MSNISVADKKKHAQEVLRYMRKATKAYQFIRNLQKELEKANKYLFIPVDMYNEELLGKYWRILPDSFENKLQLIEGREKRLVVARSITEEEFLKLIEEVAKAQGIQKDGIKGPVKIVKITPLGKVEETIDKQL